VSNSERADADRNLGLSGLQVAGINMLCVLVTALLIAGRSAYTCSHAISNWWR